jgi:hypothetical protein
MDCVGLDLVDFDGWHWIWLSAMDLIMFNKYDWGGWIGLHWFKLHWAVISWIGFNWADHSGLD